LLPVSPFPLVKREWVCDEVANAEASFPSNKSAFRFVTTVVDVTVKGAVPVAILDVKVGAVILEEKAFAPAIVCAWSLICP